MKALNPVRSRTSGGRRFDSDSNKENVHVDPNRETQEERGSNPSSVPIKESRGIEFQFVSRVAVGNKSETMVKTNSKRAVLGLIVDKV
ncbi:hypothetical protein ACOSQ3_017219 [Xanthoceras sorbifolium]